MPPIEAMLPKMLVMIFQLIGYKITSVVNKIFVVVNAIPKIKDISTVIFNMFRFQRGNKYKIRIMINIIMNNNKEISIST